MEQNVDERAGREKKRKRREQKGWTRLAKSAPRRERQSVGPTLFTNLKNPPCWMSHQ